MSPSNLPVSTMKIQVSLSARWLSWWGSKVFTMWKASADSLSNNACSDCWDLVFGWCLYALHDHPKLVRQCLQLGHQAPKLKKDTVEDWRELRAKTNHEVRICYLVRRARGTMLSIALWMQVNTKMPGAKMIHNAPHTSLSIVSKSIAK